MRLGSLVLLALVMALATALVGWWTVPVIGALWGAVRATRRGVAPDAGLAGALGWGLLLLLAAAQGPVAAVAAQVGAVMGLGAPGLVVLTLLCPFLLAWAAALVSAELTRAVRGAAAERDAGREEIPAARELGAASAAADEITARS